MSKYKDEHGTTRVGDFLRKAAPHIADVVGNILPDSGALGIVKNLIVNDKKLSEEQKAEALALLNYDLENTKDARNMQVEALRQGDNFSKRFVYYLAAFWSVSAMIYIFMATFTTIVNEKISDTILGFLLGTIVATIINFFYGSSHGSKDKTEKLKALIIK